MPHAVSTAPVAGSSSQARTEGSTARPAPHRENTSDILEYYNSAEASGVLSAADLAQTRAATRHRPSTAPQRTSEDRQEDGEPSSPSWHQSQPSKSAHGSIRLVPSTSRSTDAHRRPSLHHADSNLVVTNNRRIAIVERDISPPHSVHNTPGPSTLNSAASESASSILSRRGMDKSRLALVSPPDAAPSNQVVQSSPPSAAAFALSKSSRAKYADTHGSPTAMDSRSPTYSKSPSNRSHGRSSSEATATYNSHSPNTPIRSGNPGSPEASSFSRDVGIIGTVRTMAKQSDLESKSKSRSNGKRKESSGNVSSGSDYGDDSFRSESTPEAVKNRPMFTPVFQDAQSSESPAGTEAGSSNRAPSGMHLPLPTGPKIFGASAGHTPILTPAIGDSKPIDFKVAAPVVVDIRSDLADLWLAATPDGEVDFNSVGSPMTATTNTTGTSPLSHTFSPVDSRKSSMASSHPSRYPRYDPVSDHMAGSMPAPPRHIDVNSLAADIPPVCPPRPSRQPSPSKGASPAASRENLKSRSAASLHESGARSKGHEAHSVSTKDPKYELLADSEDESASDYSDDKRAKKTTRSYSAAAPSSLSKGGSVHMREGAFPASSVFLERLKTDGFVEAADSDLKTPTNHTRLANMFETQYSAPEISVNERKPRKGSVSSSKASHGRSSNEIHRQKSRSRPATSESHLHGEDPAAALAPSSLRSNPPLRDVKEQFHDFDWNGRSSSRERLSTADVSPESPTDSTSQHRSGSHSHLGHGPPPSGRHRQAIGPSAFKAKGPLATSGSVRTAHSAVKQSGDKTDAMWPPSMSFADVLSEQNPLARSIGYAIKINELSREDCGLREWIEETLSRTRPVVMSSSGPVPVGPAHTRFVSGNSAMSEMTFPIRPDAYKAIDLTSAGTEISATEVPSTLPYPSLALRQQLTGSRPALPPPPPPPKSSISDAVKAGSASFLATLGRRASVKTGRGTQSASEGRDKEPRAGPRKLVSARSPALRTGEITPPQSTPSKSNASLPLLPASLMPTLPGGPRAPRAKRASTMMIGAPKPIISSPIPIPSAPLSANPTGYSTTPAETNVSDSPLGFTAPLLSISKDVPRAPEGPRQQRLTRTPSFPGPSRMANSGVSRSVASFRPNASPLGMQHTNSGTPASLNQLCDVLPHVPRDILARYLSEAQGENLKAIGRYLDDERNGTVLPP